MDTLTTNINGLPKAMFNAASDEESAFSVGGLIKSTQHLVRTILTVALAIPKFFIDFALMAVHTFFAMFSYHIFWWTTPSKPFHNELFMVLGADTAFGRTFSNQIVKKNGTVICVDSDQERGELYVKALNDSVRDIRAYFYQCDVRDEAALKKVVDAVTKDVGDISVLINAAGYNSLVSTYFDVYKYVLKVMRSNKKGKLVFIRTFDKGSRDAIMALYSQVCEEINLTRTKEVSTLLAHVYPNISDDRESNGIFGYSKPEEVARTILEGLAKERNVVYMPTFMIFVGFYLKFLPISLVHSIESLLFDDKAALSRREKRNLVLTN